MALTSFADVQKFLTALTKDTNPGGAPHGAFWNTLTYSDFVTGPVPGVKDSNGNTIPILTKGNGAQSNIVQALAGTGMFDPNTGELPADAVRRTLFLQRSDSGTLGLDQRRLPRVAVLTTDFDEPPVPLRGPEVMSVGWEVRTS